MAKRNLRFSVLVVAAVLLVTSCFAVVPESPIIGLAEASTTIPVSGVEYTNGTVVPENSPLLIWYDWVSVSGTQVINFAIYTTPDYGYPVPVANLLGQHFFMADGTQVFIASALSELEVYRDFNGDGVPQTSGESEIVYYMYVNMSDSYSMTPIQKAMEGSDPHYRWSFTYENTHGYLQNASHRVGVVASLVFGHITLSYDFTVNGNVSNLKTSFDIGPITSLLIHDSSQLSLEGLSLALLYATATYTSKPYTTYVDGEEFNSATAEDSAIDAELAQVEVDGAKAYDFVFGGNYTLNRGEANQTHQTHVETYETKAEAAAFSDVPPLIRVNPVNGMEFFRDQLQLEALFGGSWQDFNMDYQSSSLIYRICFPVWDGMQIQHDPVYVGYILGGLPENIQPWNFPTAIVLSALVITIAALLIIAVIVRRRKQPSDTGNL